MYVILLITKLCFKISFATHRLFAIFFSRSSEASIIGVVGNKLFVCFTCFNGVDNVIISLCLCSNQTMLLFPFAFVPVRTTTFQIKWIHFSRILPTSTASFYCSNLALLLMHYPGGQMSLRELERSLEWMWGNGDH